MRILERPRGVGSISSKGVEVLARVPYDLRVIQEETDIGRRKTIDGMKRTVGHIEIDPLVGLRIMDLADLRLHLDDGRALKIMLTSNSGEIEGNGPLE